MKNIETLTREELTEIISKKIYYILTAYNIESSKESINKLIETYSMTTDKDIDITIIDDNDEDEYYCE